MRNRRAAGGERRVRLRNMDHAFRQHEARPQLVARPGEPWIPMALLALERRAFRFTEFAAAAKVLQLLA